MHIDRCYEMFKDWNDFVLFVANTNLISWNCLDYLWLDKLKYVFLKFFKLVCLILLFYFLEHLKTTSNPSSWKIVSCNIKCVLHLKKTCFEFSRKSHPTLNRMQRRQLRKIKKVNCWNFLLLKDSSSKVRTFYRSFNTIEEVLFSFSRSW